MFFDGNEVEETGGDFAPLPAGDYKVEVDDVKYEANSKGTGKVLTLMTSVLGDQFNGRKIFCRFNLEHTNPKAAQIGRGQFKSFLKAAGRPVQIASEADLFKIQGDIAKLKLKIVKRKDTGELTNEVAKWYAKDDVLASQSMSAPAQPNVDPIPF